MKEEVCEELPLLLPTLVSVPSTTFAPAEKKLRRFDVGSMFPWSISDGLFADFWPASSEMSPVRASALGSVFAEVVAAVLLSGGCPVWAQPEVTEAANIANNQRCFRLSFLRPHARLFNIRRRPVRLGGRRVGKDPSRI